MKDKIQIALACCFFSASALLLFAYCSNPVAEAKKVNQTSDSSAPGQSEVKEISQDEFRSDQSKNTMIIIDALSNYSEEKMQAAIAQTYDENILQKKSISEIDQNMPLLIKQLKGARLEKTISETPGKVSLKMIKNDSTYFLDIYFFENSQKIKKMRFAKLK